MPPPGGRFGPQGLSAPFGHLNHSMQQASHLQHHNSGMHSQTLGGHPGFGAGGAGAGNPNVFGPGVGNAGLQAAFGSGGAGGAGAAGVGLGAGGRAGLESDAARLGFAHGAALQQQQAVAAAAHDATGVPGMGPGNAAAKGMAGRIREVWRSNLAQEMAMLRALVDKYPYISMDTEFPGVVARPMGDFPSKASYHYQTVRCNVDLLKTIQIGITLFSTEGEVPPASLEPVSLQRPGYLNNNSINICPCTWTFNFKFSVEEDMSNEESIAVLKKAGCDFEKHAELGIEPQDFGSMLITSGLALSEDVHWISFHGGYDFAYLVKLMWIKELPSDEEDFRNLISLFFPKLLDVKFLLRHAQKLLYTHSLRISSNTANQGGNNNTQNPSHANSAVPPGLSNQALSILTNLGQKSGLQDLADELGCPRFGAQHTAGSDAWLTGSVFWALRAKIFDGHIPEDMNGQMWGLTGVGAPASAAAQAAVLAAQGHHGGPAAAAAAAGVLNGIGAGGMGGMGGVAPGFHAHGHREGAPSTPTGNAGHGARGMTGMTPGGGGGVFGNFSYGS